MGFKMDPRSISVNRNELTKQIENLTTLRNDNTLFDAIKNLEELQKTRGDTAECVNDFRSRYYRIYLGTNQLINKTITYLYAVMDLFNEADTNITHGGTGSNF